MCLTQCPLALLGGSSTTAVVATAAVEKLRASFWATPGSHRPIPPPPPRFLTRSVSLLSVFSWSVDHTDVPNHIQGVWLWWAHLHTGCKLTICQLLKFVWLWSSSNLSKTTTTSTKTEAALRNSGWLTGRHIRANYYMEYKMSCCFGNRANKLRLMNCLMKTPNPQQ